MLIDTHCHLDHESYKKKHTLIISNFKKIGIKKIITIGCSVSSSIEARRISMIDDSIFFSAGIHPHNAKLSSTNEINEIIKISKHKKCVAIGECGLDYYNSKVSKIIQKKTFIKQIEISQKMNKPLILHIRDSWDDFISIISKYKLKIPIIIHCFNGTLEYAEKCIKLGHYISVSGIVTFKNAVKLQKIIKIIPINRILLETDSPYLTPEPFRGKINEPAFVMEIAKKIAQIKNNTINQIIQKTGNNALKIFKLN